jgi:hypothetical protein
VAVSQVACRGSVVRTIYSRGLGWDRLSIGSTSATVKPWLREATIVERSRVAAVELVKLRLPPFVWSTVIRFRMSDGTLTIRMFTPWRPQRASKAFEANAWPVVQLKFRER